MDSHAHYISHRGLQVVTAAAMLGIALSIAKADTIVTVPADVVFDPTGIHASGSQTFDIHATGIANLAIFNGPYDTNPNGTITTAPPVGTGAYDFFTNSTDPIGVPPTVGSQKLIVSGGQLNGVPYGALVAGFSPVANPSSLADFPDGFQLVGASGFATAPTGGGYFFLAVNDINNTYDNSGSYRADIAPTPEPAPYLLFVTGLSALLFSRRHRMA